METSWVCSDCNRSITGRKIHFPVYCTCGTRHFKNGSKEKVVKIDASKPLLNATVDDKLRRSRDVFAGLRERREQGNRAWKAIHCFEPEIDDEQLSLRWLEDIWEPMIPQFGCNCMDFYREYKKNHPPTFLNSKDRFAWGVNLHNSVNDKLSVPAWSHEQALAYWRPHWYWQNDQPKIREITAVTSISPLDAHRDTQRECLESWKRFGLRVISGNLSSEIPSLKKQFPDVRFWPVEPSKLFDRPTPRIRDLMRLGSGSPILLINSDIAIYGPQRWLLDALETRTAIAGVRHNWTEHPGDAEQELWGLDAFLLFPEQIESFPLLDLGIGQPVWDYWVAFHLQSMNFDVRCLNDRLFFHRKHVLNWSLEMTNPGIAELESHYGKGDWNKWRRAFGEGKRELHREKKLCSIGPITVKNAR